MACAGYLDHLFLNKPLSGDGGTAVVGGGEFSLPSSSFDGTVDFAYPCFSRKLCVFPTFNSEDSDGDSCVPVRVPARGLPSALAGAAVVS